MLDVVLQHPVLPNHRRHLTKQLHCSNGHDPACQVDRSRFDGRAPNVLRLDDRRGQEVEDEDHLAADATYFLDRNRLHVSVVHVLSRTKAREPSFCDSTKLNRVFRGISFALKSIASTGGKKTGFIVDAFQLMVTFHHNNCDGDRR